ncbi:MAG: M3 family metallopeptidase [Bacteroidota bacterium]|nr:M3 family metallopeptidase [Bacteroidota bacterium]
MKKTFLIIMISVILLSCSNKDKETNPLLKDWNTEYNTVPFSEIKTSDYLPAFKKAIKLHNNEILEIINNKEKPNFENTIEALDYSGKVLTRVSKVFFNMTACNTNEEIQTLQEEISPMLSAHEDEIMMNEKLFNKVKTVWDNRSKENLNAEQLHLLKKTYNSFIRKGALLSVEKKQELKKVNEQLAVLSDKYNKNVLAETKNYKLVVSKEEDLKGLPDWLIENAKEIAEKTGEKNKWVFTLDNASCIPLLTYCDNRDLRKEIFLARINRGNNANKYDNNKITEQILLLRAKFAEILGYKNFAEWQLEDRMAKRVGRADTLLKDCLQYSIKVAKQEAEQFQNLLSQDHKGAKIEGWDMYYYAEKLKKIRYDFDEEISRQYFEIENVKKGCFDNITKLYGLRFEKLSNIETYDKDVDVYEVRNEKNEHVGILYFDPYTRNSKTAGAWCDTYQAQYKTKHKNKYKNVSPIVTVCFNFAKQKDRTTLTIDEVKTVFHEMGHATNEFLSNGTYPSTSATMVPTDLVECASQLAEHWSMQPQVLKTYAQNKDGKIIPQSLVNKIIASENFNQGFMFTELLSAAYLDLRMHSISASDTINLQEFETNVMKEINSPSQIPPRYRSTYFTHIFGGGYAAGYYCYIWSEMLDADAFQAWKETGNIFNKKISDKFKEYILAKGGTEDADLQYKRFRGKEPNVIYMLQNRGLVFANKRNSEDYSEENQTEEE